MGATGARMDWIRGWLAAIHARRHPSKGSREESTTLFSTRIIRTCNTTGSTLQVKQFQPEVGEWRC